MLSGVKNQDMKHIVLQRCNMAKETTLIRVETITKNMAKVAAEEKGMTLQGYIKMLVIKDTKGR